MKRKHILLTLSIGILLVGCSKEKLSDLSQESSPIPNKAAIDAFIKVHLESGEVFRWETAGPDLLAGALIHSDSVTFVGYKPANETNIKDKIHEIDVKSPEWMAARQKVINRIVDKTNELYPGQNFSQADLLLSDETETFPSIDIKIFNEAVVDMLRKMPEVRYVEPGSYSLDEVDYRSESGCGGSAPGSIPAADYTPTAPDAKISWHLDYMNVPAAWSITSGDGVTVCLIDTGVSPDQDKLGSSFNSGQSQGRFLDKTGTYVSSWWWWASPDGPNDQCGHGTSMAGLIAAPRGHNGTSIGVAYNADLLAIRGTGDVVINGSSEKTGVKNGLKIAGDRSDVKVISMSLGDIFWSSKVADGVYYAYNKGKMIIAAAGTSTSFTNWVGVIFPASMSETVAVTGITDGSPMQECDVCHTGSAVDFVAVMQRSNDNERTALTLSMSGNQVDRVGGSSAATATTAGIAALIWSTNLSQTRTQVFNRMKTSASFYPNKSNSFGWGIINAGQAVAN